MKKKKQITDEQLRKAVQKVTPTLLNGTGWRKDPKMSMIEYKIEQALREFLKESGIEVV